MRTNVAQLTGFNALSQFFSAVGLGEGDQFLLLHGEGSKLTALVTLEQGGLSARGVRANTGDFYGKELDFPALVEGNLGNGFHWLPSKALKGRKLEDIESASDLLYAEIDDIGKDEQWAKWQAFFATSGLNPCAVVWSGGKSYHVYFRAECRFPSIEAWAERQSKLAAIMGSDASLVSASHAMRLPGNKRTVGGELVDVVLKSASDTSIYSIDALDAGLEAAWVHPKPFTKQRFDKFKAVKGALNNPQFSLEEQLKKILPFTCAEDAYRLSDEEIAPKVTGHKVNYNISEGTGSPWGDFLDKTLTEALSNLDLAEQFLLGGFENNFKQEGNKLVGCSPWSATNSSGSSLKINIATGAWYCHASLKGSQSVKQYLQWLWFDFVGGQLRGPQFMDFCRRLAGSLGISTAELDQKKSVPAARRIESAGKPKKKEAEKLAPEEPSDKEFKQSYALKMRGIEQADWIKAAEKKFNIKLPAEIDAARVCVEAHLRDDQQLNSASATAGWAPKLKLGKNGQRVLHVLDCQKMTGKTSTSIASLVKATLQQNGRSALIVSPLRSLCATTVATLRQETGFNDGQIVSQPTYDLLKEQASQNKDGAKAEFAKIRIVVSCPESVHKFYGVSFSLVIIDEVNDVIQRLQTGALGKNPRANRENFDRLIAFAPTVAIATDQLYTPVLAAVKRAGGFSDAEINLVQRKRQQQNHTITIYRDTDAPTQKYDGTAGSSQGLNYPFLAWLNGIVKDVEANLKVSIPCGSQSKGREIDRLLRSLFPGKKGRMIDGQYTPSKYKADFVQDPDAFLTDEKLDWLIFSPAVNSGCSIDGLHFDAQHEYISPFETATSASQRGERVRDVIKREQIVRRSVFISSRGLAQRPPLEVLSADYWEAMISQDMDMPVTITEMAKSFGLDSKILREAHARNNDLDRCQELPKISAINAREIYFKHETLSAEWRGNGWTIEPGAIDIDGLATLAKTFKAVKEALYYQKSRITAKSKPASEEELEAGESKGARSLFRFTRATQQRKFGDEFQELNSSAWQLAFQTAPDARGAVESIQNLALFKIANEQPELWKNVRSLFAASGLVAATEGLSASPLRLPVTRTQVERTNLLLSCPHLYSFVNGDIESYTKSSTEVQEAAQWAREHAGELATLSKASGRLQGYQFTEKTYDIQAIHKLLRVLGIEAGTVSRTRYQYTYSVKDFTLTGEEEDTLAKAGGLPSSKALRDLFRKQAHDVTFSAADAQIKACFTTDSLVEFVRSIKGFEDRAELHNTKEILINGLLTPASIPVSAWPSGLVEMWQDRLLSCKTWGEVTQLSITTLEHSDRQALWDRFKATSAGIEAKNHTRELQKAA